MLTPRPTVMPGQTLLAPAPHNAQLHLGAMAICHSPGVNIPNRKDRHLLPKPGGLPGTPWQARLTQPRPPPSLLFPGAHLSAERKLLCVKQYCTWPTTAPAVGKRPGQLPPPWLPVGRLSLWQHEGKVLAPTAPGSKELSLHPSLPADGSVL